MTTLFTITLTVPLEAEELRMIQRLALSKARLGA
jgi:hypothetical protein